MNKILFTTANFLIILGVVFLLISPKNQDLQDLKAKIDVKKTEIQTQENYFKNLGEIQAEISKFPEEVAKVDSALPQNFSASSVLFFLQKTAAESGLVLSKVDPGTQLKLPENQNIKISPIALELSGSYPGFKSFISSAQKTSRFMEIGDIAFSPIIQKDKKGMYEFTINLKVFSY